MFNRILDIAKEIKKYCLKEFLLNGIWLKEESVIEEEDICGLKTITTIDPNGNKNTFCLRPYCFNDLDKHQVIIDSLAEEDLDKRIENALWQIAKKRNSTPIIVTQIVKLTFEFDLAESFNTYSLNIEKTDYKYLSQD